MCGCLPNWPHPEAGSKAVQMAAEYETDDEPADRINRIGLVSVILVADGAAG